jgi:hypothetical protein
MCPSVVGFGDVSEALLTGSVPDLKFDFTVVEIDEFLFEIDTDG